MLAPPSGRLRSGWIAAAAYVVATAMSLVIAAAGEPGRPTGNSEHDKRDQAAASPDSVLVAPSEAILAHYKTARAALDERKVVDRAKGLLMSSRNLSEKDAYTLMRETAMRQNKRIVDIAESIVSMADILQA